MNVALRTSGHAADGGSSELGDPGRSAAKAAAQSASLLTLAGVATGIGNLLFNVVVARTGGASAYGAIGALLGFTTAATALAAGMQYAVARRTAIGLVDTRELCWRSVTGTWPLALICIALLPLTLPAASYLRLSSALPIVLSVFLFAWTVVAAIPNGILIGLGRFKLLAGLLTAQVILRIPAGAVLSRILDPTLGSVIASLLPPLVLGIATFMIVSRLSSPSPRNDAIASNSQREQGILAESSVGAMYTAGLWAVWTLPLAFGRHALRSDASGSLAAAQVLSSAIIFLCAPLLTALFPTIARHANARTIGGGLIATMGLGLGATAGLTLLGPPLIGALYGHGYIVDRGLVLVLAISAMFTAAASYGLWTARALLRFQVSAGVGVAVALCTEVLLALIGASSPSLYAAEPALAIVAGVIAAIGTEWRQVRTASPTKTPVPVATDSSSRSGSRLIVLNWKDPAHPQAGGAERYVKRIAELWATQGHDVTLFVPEVRGQPRHEVIAGVSYVREGSLLTVFRRARRHLRQHRGRYDHVLESVSTRPFHAHRVAGAGATALYHQIANDVWRHEYRFPMSWVGRRVLEPRWIAGMRGSRVISVSESTAADLRDRGVASMGIVPPAAPFPATLKHRSSPSPNPRIVFIGRLSRTKRPLDAVIAFQLLQRRLPSATMDIIGAGYLATQLQQMLTNGITWHGRATESEKNEILESADLMLLPGTREGWGIVAMEAAGHGVPVVTYDVPGLREAVVDGVTGSVTPPTPSAMATAAEAILEDPDMWSAMSRSAQERATRHTWEGAASQILRHMVPTTDRSETLAGRAREVAGSASTRQS